MGWVATATPGLLTPRKTQYPLYRKLGGPQCRSGTVRKISPPPGFDPRTVQSVASRYTDCAIPDHLWRLKNKIKDSWRHYPAKATIINTERILPGNSLHPRLEAQGWANYCFWISFQVVVIIRCLVSVYFRSSFYPATSNCFGYTTTKCMQHRPPGGRYSHAAVQQILLPLRSSIDTILPLDYTGPHKPNHASTS